MIIWWEQDRHDLGQGETGKDTEMEEEGEGDDDDAEGAVEDRRELGG